MGLRLDDRWLWDFWVVTDGDHAHVFYLQAPRTPEDPERRHWNVSIGHAVSSDLRTWTVLDDALAPGEPGAWDDFTTWTGSVVWAGDRWVMFYTGTNRAEDGLVQRVGSVESTDLVTWHRTRDHSLTEVDPAIYETLDRTIWHDQAWRDPWVHQRSDGTWMMMVTARVKDGPGATRGVIGTATSDDLESWQVGPPLTEPGHFGHMEIPQLERLDDRWILAFSSPARATGEEEVGPLDQAGTHYLVGDSPDGPFPWDTHRHLVGADGRHYGAKLVHHDGRWQCLAWLANDDDGSFLGELSDPWDVTFADHHLSLVPRPAWTGRG